METGMTDDKGVAICVGQTLQSKYGYQVVVVSDGDGFMGRLVCTEGDSCRDIPYSLNSGAGYTVLTSSDKPTHASTNDK